jgi:hypothetical protein
LSFLSDRGGDTSSSWRDFHAIFRRHLWRGLDFQSEQTLRMILDTGYTFFNYGGLAGARPECSKLFENESEKNYELGFEIETDECPITLFQQTVITSVLTVPWTRYSRFEESVPCGHPKEKTLCIISQVSPRFL